MSEQMTADYLIEMMSEELGPFGSFKRQRMAQKAARLPVFRKVIGELKAFMSEMEIVKVVSAKLSVSDDVAASIMELHGFYFSDKEILDMIQEDKDDGHWDDYRCF